MTTGVPVVQNKEARTQPVISKPFNSNLGYTGADLVACKTINSDFIGWLQIPGTKVDYPVVLTNDVDYYLDHTFNHQESIISYLFSLGKTYYSTPGRSIAVYSLHMRRSRSTTMFQPLHEYKSDSFRNAHADICFDILHGSRSYIRSCLRVTDTGNAFPQCQGFIGILSIVSCKSVYISKNIQTKCAEKYGVKYASTKYTKVRSYIYFWRSR